jgi:hypothetical protein
LLLRQIQAEVAVVLAALQMVVMEAQVLSLFDTLAPSGVQADQLQHLAATLFTHLFRLARILRKGFYGNHS